MSYRVGLTGGIGSGKSTVARLFAEHGVPIVDTDAISHQLTGPDGAAINALRHEFGNDFINAKGALDRAKMRQLVFTDSSAKQRLEQILHPLILEQSRALAAASSAPYVIIVIPLLFESGTYQHWLQRTLVVDCSESTQIKRAVERGGLGEDAVRAIISHQLARAQRLQLADDIIRNDSDISSLKSQVDHLHQTYRELSERSN